MSKEKQFIDTVEKLAKEAGIDSFMIGFASGRNTHTSGYVNLDKQGGNKSVLHNQVLNIYANILGKFKSDYADSPDIIKSVEESAERVRIDYSKWTNLQLKKSLH